MDYAYEYIDPDFKYTDPKTGILRNLFGETEKQALQKAEYAETAKQTRILKSEPLKIKNIETVLMIHKRLFKNIYEWAGEPRQVNIKKTGGIPKDGFHPFQFFGNGFREVDKKIQECRSADPSDKDGLALKLADMLDALNALHPFREGNGRTQRLTIEFLALEKGYALNLSPDNEKGCRGYMDGTTNADKNLLAKTIAEQMAKIPQKPKEQKPPPKGGGATQTLGP